MKKLNESNEEITQRIFEVLAHPIRRKIIRIIGEKGSVKYKELAKFGIEPGTLYFHINSLLEVPNFIYQNKEREYLLTPLGSEAYKILVATEEKATMIESAKKVEKRDTLKIVDRYLSFEFLIPYIIENPKRTLFEFSLFIILLAYISSLNGLVPILFWIEIMNASFLITLSIVLVSWGFSSMVAYFFLRFIFKVETNLRLIILSLPMAYLPTFIYVATFQYFFINLVQRGEVVFVTIGFIITELWSIYILSKYISKLNGLILPKALLIGVSLGYVSMLSHIIIGVSH